MVAGDLASGLSGGRARLDADGVFVVHRRWALGDDEVGWDAAVHGIRAGCAGQPEGRGRRVLFRRLEPRAMHTKRGCMGIRGEHTLAMMLASMGAESKPTRRSVVVSAAKALDKRPRARVSLYIIKGNRVTSRWWKRIKTSEWVIK